MPAQTPSFLRIHCGPDPTDPSPADPGRNSDCDPALACGIAPHDVSESGLIDDFWRSFAETTQWCVDAQSDRGDVNLLPLVTDALEIAADVSVSRSAAKRLAELGMEITARLAENQQALQRQASELAARAAVIVGASDQQRLADQLEATLAEAATACRCDSAALYLLDDDTEYLHTRAVYELPTSRLSDQPRTLRGSRADLEAMVQGVIAINDLNQTTIDTWNCPESSPRIQSAICAVIAADEIPIGTLWLFARETNEFGDAEIAAARMAAKQLALQLSIASAPGEQPSVKAPAAIAEVAHWQLDSLPIGANLATGWAVDGMIESPRDWAIGWHAWDVLPDGSLMLAIAEAIDPSIRGAMAATTARAALQSHLGYRHTPTQILQRINDTLWQTSTCQQLMSMLYVRIDPESGEGEFASAGPIQAMIGSGYGYRPLAAATSQPLCLDFHAAVVSDSFRMMPGETLLAYGAGLEDSGISQFQLGDALRAAMQSDADHPLAAIRRQIAGVQREV